MIIALNTAPLDRCLVVDLEQKIFFARWHSKEQKFVKKKSISYIPSVLFNKPVMCVHKKKPVMCFNIPLAFVLLSLSVSLQK